jgi:hypothetical protein
MGYAQYTLSDGREAGYAVQATCDEPNCDAKIDRGMAYCCLPVGGGEHGCGHYFCSDHLTYSLDVPKGESQSCFECDKLNGGAE